MPAIAARIASGGFTPVGQGAAAGATPHEHTVASGGVPISSTDSKNEGTGMVIVADVRYAAKAMMVPLRVIFGRSASTCDDSTIATARDASSIAESGVPAPGGPNGGAARGTVALRAPSDWLSAAMAAAESSELPMTSD